MFLRRYNARADNALRLGHLGHAVFGAFLGRGVFKKLTPLQMTEWAV